MQKLKAKSPELDLGSVRIEVAAEILEIELTVACAESTGKPAQMEILAGEVT
jgi:hypothetical protein